MSTQKGTPDDSISAAASPAESGDRSDLLDTFFPLVARQLRLQKSREEIDTELADLKIKAADQDDEALRLLYYYAMESAAALEELAAQNLDFVQKFARTQGGWPVRLGPYPKIIKECREQLEKLGVGSQTGDVLSPKKLFRNPKNQNPLREIVKLALIMIQTVRDFEKAKILVKTTRTVLGEQTTKATRGMPKELCCGDAEFIQMCVQLPTLSTAKKPFEQWFLVVKRAIELQTDGKPELNAVLGLIGEYRQAHFSGLNTKGTVELPISKDSEEPLERFSEGSVFANIRDGIWKAVRRQLKALAPDPRTLASKKPS